MVSSVLGYCLTDGLIRLRDTLDDGKLLMLQEVHEHGGYVWYKH